jgi:hypothetical protein
MYGILSTLKKERAKKKGIRVHWGIKSNLYDRAVIEDRFDCLSALDVLHVPFVAKVC